MPQDIGKRLVELAAGVYVEQDTLNIVQRIQGFDPNLVVKYLDPDSGGEVGDPPYKIYERCPDGFERLVFGVWSLDERVLERLFRADTRKHDIIAGLDANNAKVRADEKRRYREEVLGEAHDIATHVLKSPKHSYTATHPSDRDVKVVYDSTEPVHRRNTKTGAVVDASELRD